MTNANTMKLLRLCGAGTAVVRRDFSSCKCCGQYVNSLSCTAPEYLSKPNTSPKDIVEFRDLSIARWVKGDLYDLCHNRLREAVHKSQKTQILNILELLEHDKSVIKIKTPKCECCGKGGGETKSHAKHYLEREDTSVYDTIWFWYHNRETSVSKWIEGNFYDLVFSRLERL